MRLLTFLRDCFRATEERGFEGEDEFTAEDEETTTPDTTDCIAFDNARMALSTTLGQAALDTLKRANENVPRSERIISASAEYTKLNIAAVGKLSRQVKEQEKLLGDKTT